jgi:hypothetical protein
MMLKRTTTITTMSIMKIFDDLKLWTKTQRVDFISNWITKKLLENAMNFGQCFNTSFNKKLDIRKLN